jgi:RNA ligase (TIGR02306 family)
MNGLAYTGKVVELKRIEGADRILAATVICGSGGKWQCVMPLETEAGQLVTVFMPDALVPERPELEFMRKHKWRVKMSRFKGVPSEALAIPDFVRTHSIGDDVTEELSVEKFIKPLPISLGGDILGNFPEHLISKTDELRYQAVPELVEAMRGLPVDITQKQDGTSVTVVKDFDDVLHVCSRNYEMKDTPNSALWNTVKTYTFDRLITRGLAVQFELCGPQIQGNPLKLKKLTPFVFNLYNVLDEYYYPYEGLIQSQFGDFAVPMLYSGLFDFSLDHMQAMADDVKYGNKPGEGMVVRAQNEKKIQIPQEVCPVRPSFKVINLNYKD